MSYRDKKGWIFISGAVLNIEFFILLATPVKYTAYLTGQADPPQYDSSYLHRLNKKQRHLTGRAGQAQIYPVESPERSPQSGIPQGKHRLFSLPTPCKYSSP